MVAWIMQKSNVPKEGQRTKPMTDYEQDLHEWLKDPENAAEYLNAAIEDGDTDVILLAMRRAAQARRV